MAPLFYCLQFPPSIRAELKLKYKHHYSKSVFLDHLDEKVVPGTLILPAETLINRTETLTCPCIIAFGRSEYLETAFLAGARDYLKDPWNTKELLIRTYSKHERLCLFPGNHTIFSSPEYLYIDGELINLSQFQIHLLYTLIRHSNRILSYEDLRDCMGMSPSSSYRKSLHVHMARLKAALKIYLFDIYGKEIFINNCRSLGYSLTTACGKLVDNCGYNVNNSNSEA